MAQLLFSGCAEKTNTDSAKSNQQETTETPEQAATIDITKLTAEEIINHFIKAGFPIENVIVYTEETDENSLLGRPNQYTSKINFADNRVEQFDIETDPIGGTFEVFENAADAKNRKEYVESVTSAMSALSQYIYLYENILFRVNKELTPDQASEYENAFNSLCEGKEIDYQAGDETKASETPETAENPYEITFQNVTFHQDSINTLWSQAFVEVINNSNDLLYLKKGSYELESEDGTLIHTTSNLFEAYPQIIAPGEKGYYYEVTTMDSGTPTEGISINPHINPEISKSQNIRLEVSDTEIYDKDTGTIDLHGKVKNTTSAEQSNIYVAAILLNESGEPIGHLYTILMNSIQPGEEIGFELEPLSLPEDISTASIADYVVFAYPQQFQF